MFGPEYPKINTVFKRDERKLIIPSEWATNEIAYLVDSQWDWTEKVDGTNIRLHWNGSQLTVGGRTNDAQIPTFLNGIIQSWQLELKLSTVFGIDATTNVTLYGEGYGPKIQKGGQYRNDRASFVLFDVLVIDLDGHGWWLSRDNVFDVSKKLGIEVISSFGRFSLREAVRRVHSKSITSFWTGAKIEGLVGRPVVDLFNRRGERIMVKIKGKDFLDLERIGRLSR